jgi:CHAT domain-containing protein
MPNNILNSKEQWISRQYQLAEALMKSDKGDKAQNIERAIKSLEEALTKIDFKSMPYGWAILKIQLGVAYTEKPCGDAENIENAISAFQAALTGIDPEERPDPWAMLQSYIGRAYAVRKKGILNDNLKQAIIAYEASFEIHSTQSAYSKSNPTEWGNRLFELGQVYLKLNYITPKEIVRAINVFKTVLEVFTAKTNFDVWSCTQINLSKLYRHPSLGNRAENIELALQSLQTVLNAVTMEKHLEIWATTHYNLGMTYMERPSIYPDVDLKRAIQSLEASSVAFLKLKDSYNYANAQLDLCVAYRKLRHGNKAENIEKAIQSADAALAFFTAETSPWNWATAQQEKASAYTIRKEGDPVENILQAIALYKEGLTVFTRDQDPTNWAITQANLGSAYRILSYHQNEEEENDNIQYYNEYQELAIKAYKAALTVRTRESFNQKYISQGFDRSVMLDAREWVGFQRELGQLYEERIYGDSHENIRMAIAHYKAALEVCTPEFGATMTRLIASSLGNLYGVLKDWDMALSIYKIALRATNLEYSFAPIDENKMEHIAETAMLYESTIDTCLQVHPVRSLEAFLLMEEGRSKLLRDQLGALPIPKSRNIPGEIIELETQLIQELRHTQQQINRSPEGQNNWQLADQIVTIRNKLDALWDTLNTKYNAAEYVSLRRGEKIDWIDVQQWLSLQERQVAFLEFFSVAGKLIAFVIRRGDAEPHLINMKVSLLTIQESVEHLIREVHHFDPEHPVPETWRDVAPFLLDEVMPCLKEIELLYIVPYGPLHLWPFHALIHDGMPLIHKFPIAYVPSVAAALRLTDLTEPKASDKKSKGTLLIVGNATGNIQDKELPKAEEEAIGIARRFGTTPLLRGQATKGAVQSELERVQQAHFATHAFFDHNDPFASGIELSDGVLTAREIAAQPLQAKAIVLSACETGIQKVEAGEELVGLPRAFLYAGVPSLVLSMWEIEDEYAKIWMQSFYDHLYGTEGVKKMSTAEAVRLATLDIYKKSPHTCEWAPFILYGNWK